jgi:hypothetical protein
MFCGNEPLPHVLPELGRISGEFRAHLRCRMKRTLWHGKSGGIRETRFRAARSDSGISKGSKL